MRGYCLSSENIHMKCIGKGKLIIEYMTINLTTTIRRWLIMKIKGMVVNDTLVRYDSDEDMLIGVLNLAIRHAKYQPVDVIIYNVIESCNMYLEYLGLLLEGNENKKECRRLKNLYKKVYNFKINFERRKGKQNTQVLLMKSVYDFILRISGMGVLHGFGVVNTFKDRLSINPERASIVSV